MSVQGAAGEGGGGEGFGGGGDGEGGLGDGGGSKGVGRTVDEGGEGGSAEPQLTDTNATAASPCQELPRVYSKANDGE